MRQMARDLAVWRGGFPRLVVLAVLVVLTAPAFADERTAEDDAARERGESSVRPSHGPGSKARGGGREEGAAPLEASARPDEEGPRYHVTVLAENQKGYANLCRLITQSHMQNPRGDPKLEPLLKRAGLA